MTTGLIITFLIAFIYFHYRSRKRRLAKEKQIIDEGQSILNHYAKNKTALVEKRTQRTGLSDFGRLRNGKVVRKTDQVAKGQGILNNNVKEMAKTVERKEQQTKRPDDYSTNANVFIPKYDGLSANYIIEDDCKPKIDDEPTFGGFGGGETGGAGSSGSWDDNNTSSNDWNSSSNDSYDSVSGSSDNYSGNDY